MTDLTKLLDAIRKNNTPISTIRDLLTTPEIQATITITDNNNLTAVHWAAIQGRSDIVELLQQHGGADNQALANWRHPQTHSTFLHLVVVQKNIPISTIQYLLTIPEIQATITITDNNNLTAVHWAAVQGRSHIVELLQQCGGANNQALAKWRNLQTGQTLLAHIVSQNNIPISTIQYLLNIPKIKETINMRCAQGLAAVHCAAVMGRRDIVELLQEYGGANNQALANWRHLETDSTLLAFTVRENDTLINIQYLLTIPEIKLTIGIADNRGLTAVHSAAVLGRRDIVELLQRHGGADNKALADWRHPETDLTLLEFSISITNIAINRIEYLLTIPEIKLTIGIADNSGLTAVHSAAVLGRRDIVELLQRHGGANNEALVNWRHPNTNISLLEYARQNNNPQYLENIFATTHTPPAPLTPMYDHHHNAQERKDAAIKIQRAYRRKRPYRSSSTGTE